MVVSAAVFGGLGSILPKSDWLGFSGVTLEQFYVYCFYSMLRYFILKFYLWPVKNI